MYTNRTLENRPTEALENDIASLSAAIQAATYRLLCLIGELDLRGDWADPLGSNGFRSCAHWLSWRVGLNLGAARQYVRVARALPDLPRISAAFRRAEVSYSKVRAITRIATPETEEMLLDWAKAGAAAQVEKLVRRYRQADPAKENESARAQEDGRHLVTYFDSDGTLVVRGRLTPEQGALFLKALDVAGETLRDEQRTGLDAEEVTTSANAAAPQSDGRQVGADALARVAERALAAHAAAAEAPRADRFQVVVHVDAEVLADPEADGRADLEDGPKVSAETARRLACDCTRATMAHGPDGALTPGRKTRVVSAPLRRALTARDGPRCAFPGCGCKGRDAHHVVHWGAGGPTVLENLVLLCRAHHTLVHEGGFRVERLPSSAFRFVRPDGRALLEAPSLPPLPAVPVAIAGHPEDALGPTWIPRLETFPPDTGQST